MYVLNNHARGGKLDSGGTKHRKLGIDRFNDISAQSGFIRKVR